MFALMTLFDYFLILYGFFARLLHCYRFCYLSSSLSLLYHVRRFLEKKMLPNFISANIQHLLNSVVYMKTVNRLAASHTVSNLLEKYAQKPRRSWVFCSPVVLE